MCVCIGFIYEKEGGREGEREGGRERERERERESELKSQKPTSPHEGMKSRQERKLQ